MAGGKSGGGEGDGGAGGGRGGSTCLHFLQEGPRLFQDRRLARGTTFANKKASKNGGLGLRQSCRGGAFLLAVAGRATARADTSHSTSRACSSACLRSFHPAADSSSEAAAAALRAPRSCSRSCCCCCELIASLRAWRRGRESAATLAARTQQHPRATVRFLATAPHGSCADAAAATLATVCTITTIACCRATI